MLTNQALNYMAMFQENLVCLPRSKLRDIEALGVNDKILFLILS